jgi:hypothetical protein
LDAVSCQREASQKVFSELKKIMASNAGTGFLNQEASFKRPTSSASLSKSSENHDVLEFSSTSAFRQQLTY